MSTQVLVTRANGPPRQWLEDEAPRKRDTQTGTALRKANDRVIGAAFKEVRAPLLLIDTNEADVLGVCRFLVAVEDLPTGSGGNITQGVGRKGILVRL